MRHYVTPENQNWLYFAQTKCHNTVLLVSSCADNVFVKLLLVIKQLFLFFSIFQYFGEICFACLAYLYACNSNDDDDDDDNYTNYNYNNNNNNNTFLKGYNVTNIRSWTTFLCPGIESQCHMVSRNRDPSLIVFHNSNMSWIGPTLT